jgi:hypothetical protein
VGGDAFFCVKNFICRLSMIKLHACIILFINFWYLSVGSSVNVLKLLAISEGMHFLGGGGGGEYYFESIITILAVVCVTTAFSVVNFLFSFSSHAVVLFEAHLFDK